MHDGITPDPTYPVLQAGFEAVRAHRSDAILAVGGGSAIDAAKVIGAMAVSGKSPGEARRHAQGRQADAAAVRDSDHRRHRVRSDRGCGGDRSRSSTSKSAVIDPKLVPLAAALDPLLMKGMPRPITAATGMDALTHAVEAYINRWPHADTEQHCVAAVRMIFANLQRAYDDGNDLAAREAMALASFYAGLAFTKAYVGYVHAFSHKIGGMYGVPHGLANAITLPYVLDFLKDAPLARERLAELAVVIGAGTAGEPQDVAGAAVHRSRARTQSRRRHSREDRCAQAGRRAGGCARRDGRGGARLPGAEEHVARRGRGAAATHAGVVARRRDPARSARGL